mmetsp:Transcript_70016/g.205305  ORF Transcript_70016/g.205305 Transcript_70016/m.205305 type:complete len:220 (+) Transcript_70016:112-771(+)
MGAVGSCAADGPHNGRAALKQMEASCNSVGCDVSEDVVALALARCDVAADCLPAGLVGLDDKACADVLLVQAAMRGDVEDVRAALSKGASVDTCADLVLNMGEFAKERVTGVTPLMRACSRGHQEVVSHLLDVRANPCRSDSVLWTPLCYAAGNGELGVVRLLLENMPKNVAERQKAAVLSLKEPILEYCEEQVGKEAAEALERETRKGGALAPDVRKV